MDTNIVKDAIDNATNDGANAIKLSGIADIILYKIIIVNFYCLYYYLSNYDYTIVYTIVIQLWWWWFIKLLPLVITTLVDYYQNHESISK